MSESLGVLRRGMGRSTIATSPQELPFRKHKDVALVPGDFIVVITAGGRFWMGPSGDVKLGSPGVYIIGLDCVSRALQRDSARAQFLVSP
jgi:hypothetical protein